MLQGIQHRILSNAGTKIFALALALFVYLHVFVSEENEVVMDIPLELAGVPEGLTYTGKVPETVRVRFRGVGLDLLKMRARLDRARLVVEVGDVRPGYYQRPLVSEDVLLPADLNVQAVQVESPHEISLEFDRLLSKEFAIAAQLSGRVAPGFTVYGRTVVEPESVLVSGPYHILQTYERVQTAVINLDGRRDVLTQRVGVEVCPECKAIPAEVTVRVTIEPVISRTFTELPVQVLLSRGVHLKSIVPETGSVTVSGPAGVVESLAPDDLRVSIEARGLPPGGTYTLMASVELRRPTVSGELSIEPVLPERFEVQLE